MSANPQKRAKPPRRGAVASRPCEPAGCRVSPHLSERPGLRTRPPPFAARATLCAPELPKPGFRRCAIFRKPRREQKSQDWPASPKALRLFPTTATLPPRREQKPGLRSRTYVRSSAQKTVAVNTRSTRRASMRRRGPCDAGNPQGAPVREPNESVPPRQ